MTRIAILALPAVAAVLAITAIVAIIAVIVSRAMLVIVRDFGSHSVSNRSMGATWQEDRSARFVISTRGASFVCPYMFLDENMLL